MRPVPSWYGWNADGRAEGRSNRWAWFRRIVDIGEVPTDATLRVAADSTARWWLNGVMLSRQSTRYHRHLATSDRLDVNGVLRPGRNVLVALLHHWGPITCFQRSAGGLAGLWADATWLDAAEPWRVQPAAAYRNHEVQILGSPCLTPRIRFPQLVIASELPPPALHTSDYDDRSWAAAVPLCDIPWPAEPAPVEGPVRRDQAIRPGAVVAAGQVRRRLPLDDDPALIGPGLTSSTCLPVAEDTAAARALLDGRPLTVSGAAGESRFITVDFQRILHGYPRLRLSGATGPLRLDLGYSELWRTQRHGREVVDASGWLDTGAVVGARLADRVIVDGTALGTSCDIEMPDERTCRWLTVHIHFRSAGSVSIDALELISSQHPFTVTGSCTISAADGSDDRRLAQVVDLCLDHAAVTMTDVLVDTPGREDGQWLEDATPRAELAARWSGDTSLRRRFLRLVADSQDAHGVFHLFPPASFSANWNLWDWQMQWGQMLWEEYRWSADQALVQRHFPVLQRSLTALLAGLGEDGLWRSDRILADIRTSAWVPPGGVSGVVTPWLIARLPRFAALADVAGEDVVARRWRAAAVAMRAAFNRHLLSPATADRPALIVDALDAAGQPRPGFSQAAHTEAIAEGVVPDDLAMAMLDHVFPAPHGAPPAGIQRWNNPTYSERALRAMSRHGLGGRALAHLLERYAQYLPGDPANPTPPAFQGPRGGPLPEYWISREDVGLAPGQLNVHQPDDDTGSHGWGAVPLLWLHEWVLGVRWSVPGGAELDIAPDRCGRPRVHGRTCTPKGVVAVDANSTTLQVSVPAGVAAMVAVPTGMVLASGRANPLADGRWRCDGPLPICWTLGS